MKFMIFFVKMFTNKRVPHTASHPRLPKWWLPPLPGSLMYNGIGSSRIRSGILRSARYSVESKQKWAFRVDVLAVVVDMVFERMRVLWSGLSRCGRVSPGWTNERRPKLLVSRNRGKYRRTNGRSGGTEPVMIPTSISTAVQSQVLYPSPKAQSTWLTPHLTWSALLLGEI